MRTKITNQEYLIAALEKLGFAKKVEIHKEATNLYGYEGDKRKQTAEIIIRRKHVGCSSNDIGFKLQKDGTYEAIISDYDKTKYNQKWLDKLNQQYTHSYITDQLNMQGFFIESETTENGEIFITAKSNF